MIEPPATQKELFKAAKTQPGYRTLNKATVQMAEAARDSVFRQIALRMNGEGGEMRVLLNPPELGRLDIHMIVEKSGMVHLSLAAERPELALILEKHVGELKQALEAQGLSIGNTEIRGREEQLQDRDGWGKSSSGDEQSDDGEDWTAAAFRRAGYITAEGLDFWV
jgi:flagellar hook-length control protein FliK